MAAELPKLRPLIVTDPPEEQPTFGGLLMLTHGAGTPTRHDIKEPTNRGGNRPRISDEGCRPCARTVEAELPQQSPSHCTHHRSPQHGRAAVGLRRTHDRRHRCPRSAAAPFRRRKRGRCCRTGGAEAQPADRDRAAAAAKPCVCRSGQNRAHDRRCMSNIPCNHSGKLHKQASCSHPAHRRS